jgi:flagellar basal-body rod protein FlgB
VRNVGWNNSVIGGYCMADMTYDLLKKSLDASALRQRVIANNIANENTKGFKRSEVVFEEILNEELQKGTSPEDLTRIEPKVIQDNSTSMREDGNNVDIEVEMANMAANDILYNTLITQLNTKYDILRLAINGGK